MRKEPGSTRFKACAFREIDWIAFYEPGSCAGRPAMFKDIPASARPREKLLALGPAALADAELIALLLRGGVAKVSTNATPSPSRSR